MIFHKSYPKINIKIYYCSIVNVFVLFDIDSYVNSWVLVTGATDGIGREYCRQFAKLGFNIILVSRSKEKLAAVEIELKLINPYIKTGIIEFDFIKNTSIIEYQQSFENLQVNYDISILVNNIGISNKNTFNNYSIDYVRDSINANILPQTLLTKIFISKMLIRSNKSAIINVSSFACLTPMVNSSLYSATKVYNDYLSRVISTENTNIDCLSVRPLFVATNSNKRIPSYFWCLTTEQTVSGVLNVLGLDNITYGHWIHNFQAIIFNYISDDIKIFLVKRVLPKLVRIVN